LNGDPVNGTDDKSRGRIDAESKHSGSAVCFVRTISSEVPTKQNFDVASLVLFHRVRNLSTEGTRCGEHAIKLVAHRVTSTSVHSRGVHWIKSKTSTFAARCASRSNNRASRASRRACMVAVL
jgi:hypothetical protein